MSNLLKRKNDEVDDESASADQLNKRVALDAEQLASLEKIAKVVQFVTPASADKPDSDADQPETNDEKALEKATSPDEEGPSASIERPRSITPPAPAPISEPEPRVPDYVPHYASEPPIPQHSPPFPEPAGQYAPQPSYASHSDPSVYSQPASMHSEREEINQISVRMLVPVKEAGIIVGKKGDTISHLREKANVRINISDNLKDVPERIVTVKGTSENVARAFGLITRIILEEPEDEPASLNSKQYQLKILLPHAIIGYVIGKGGSKFREIEESSAAKLKAEQQPLPYSTDRVLNVVGVADAIHIALYYTCQVLLEHQDVLKKHKVVYYTPISPHSQMPPAGSPMMDMPMQQNSMPFMHGAPPPMQMPGMAPGLPQVSKPYDFRMMFQPSTRPQYPPNPPMTAPPPMQVPQQNLYTDEHGNTIVGDVITQIPVPVSGNPDRFSQDVYVANVNIGSVIGRGGNNIKAIRENSGCSYVKIEPDQHQLILLGGGRGLTSVRKLTLTGNYQSLQTAIYLINQRIISDKERNGVQ